MMKSLFFVFFLAVFTLGKSQSVGPVFAKAADMKRIRNGKLIVALFDTTGESATFVVGKSYNKWIKEAMTNYWNCCPVEYKNIGELEGIKDTTVFFLIPGAVDKTFERGGITRSTSNSYLKIGSSTSFYKREKLIGKNYLIDFYKSLVMVEGASFDYLSIASYVSGMQIFIMYKTYTKEEKDEYNNRQKLKYKDVRTQTVYFAKEDLDKKLTEADVKAIYNYPFKIVAYEEILKAVRARKSDVAFAVVESLGYKDLKALFIKNAATLNNLAYVSSKDFEIEKKTIEALNKFVSKEKE